MNVIVIDGRLTRDTEIKLKDDKEILQFTIANQRNKDHTEFIDCVAFDNNARFINNYFKKGSGINIVGTLRKSVYQNKDGKTESITRVYVDSVSFPIKTKEEHVIDDSQVVDSVWESAKDTTIPEEDLPFY